VRLWKSSLTLRVVSSALLGTLLALVIAGVFLSYRITSGIVEGAQAAARSDANEAMAVIETNLRSAGYDHLGGDTLARIADQAISRGNASERYLVQFMTTTGARASSSLDLTSIPDSIREAVRAEPYMVHYVPTEVHFLNGAPPVPGYVVGSTVSGGGSDRFAVFFVFSFAVQDQILTVVSTAIAFSAAVIFIGMGLVAYLLSHQTLRPLRIARRAAERLSSGELTQLMPVKGTDDLAQLAASMNHMANQLQTRIRDMKQLSKVQKRFVSDVSHELRTPLTTVRLAADVLYDRRDTLPEMEGKSIELLHEEVNRFEALLADLLEISRFDAGAALLALDDVSLTDMAEREIEGLAEVTASMKTQVILHSSSTCIANVDPRRVSRVMRNLLSNAIEHSEGKPVDLTVTETNDVVAFAVRDHGVGFSSEEGKQLFNRFWRADPARARHIGGTGLGLSIAQEDVRLHQGWIHAWGRPGNGAQFRVVLPKTEDRVVTYSPLPLVPVDAEEEQ
jgi:two-component system sensor histidine kinase MtrB